MSDVKIQDATPMPLTNLMRRDKAPVSHSVILQEPTILSAVVSD